LLAGIGKNMNGNPATPLWVKLRQTKNHQPQRFLARNLRFFNPDANRFRAELF
jgi:hypothetical protein